MNRQKESIEHAMNSVDCKSNRSNRSKKSRRSNSNNVEGSEPRSIKRSSKQSPVKIPKEAVTYSIGRNKRELVKMNSKMNNLKEFFHASPYGFFNEILEQKKRMKYMEKEYQK